MGIQSAVMAKSFGENFQFGKRRISAMSNEDFNKLTPKLLMEQNTRELQAMIPSMEKAVLEMRTFQTFLIREFLRTLNDAIRAGLGELFGIKEETLADIEHFLHGHGGGHDEPTSGPPPPGETINLEEFEMISPDEVQGPPEATTTSTTFPPIYNNNNPVSTQSIGRVTHVGTEGLISIYQPDSRFWKAFKSYPTFSQALGTAGTIWPAPKYKLIMVGTTGFFVRLL